MLKLIAVTLVLLAGSTGSKADRVPEGSWGGERLMVEVGAEQTGVEFDCGSGVIEGPFVLGEKGRFELKGSYRREAGPQRSDGSDVKPAVYRGSLTDGELTLTIVLDGSDEPLGTWTLTQGRTVRLRKCR